MSDDNGLPPVEPEHLDKTHYLIRNLEYEELHVKLQEFFTQCHSIFQLATSRCKCALFLTCNETAQQSQVVMNIFRHKEDSKTWILEFQLRYGDRALFYEHLIQFQQQFGIITNEQQPPTRIQTPPDVVEDQKEECKHLKLPHPVICLMNHLSSAQCTRQQLQWIVAMVQSLNSLFIVHWLMSSEGSLWNALLALKRLVFKGQAVSSCIAWMQFEHKLWRLLAHKKKQAEVREWCVQFQAIEPPFATVPLTLHWSGTNTDEMMLHLQKIYLQQQQLSHSLNPCI